jgi:ABC-type branched-subunit amino acid transport system ATPase component
MIEAEGLVKHFGDVAAVDSISFSVRAGEIFAFLGPNGAGKTTTIHILTTMLKPTSGHLRVDGLDPVAQPYDVRARFGIVFQDPSLDVELTAYENLELHGVVYRMSRRTRHNRIQDMLTLFGLWDRRDMMVKHYSGGMKRRLEIARGLLHTPRVLFLNEPTLGPRPAEPQPTLDSGKAPQRHRGDHRLPYHPLHGRGRTRGQPHCDRRSWPHRGARLGRRTEIADRHRITGGSLPRIDGHHHPRRAV